MKVIIKLDQNLINPFLARVTDLSAKNAAQKTASRANANVRARGRVRTGRLASSYKATRTSAGPNASAYSVGSDVSYAPFQEEGIGPVKAKKGHVLRFRPKGSSVFIFRPRAKGFRGAHQLGDAYKAISLGDFLP